MSLPHCKYFEAGRCRSCALIETPYEAQLRDKQLRCRETLPSIPDGVWLSPFRSEDHEFRNKAKLVVGGVAGAVTLGILGPDGRGVDLRDCLIQSPGIRQVIPKLAAFLEVTELEPYDVPRRKGELKYVHVTEAPGGEFMLRFVVRSEHGLDRLRRALAQLREAVPGAAVISVNLLPEHKAVLEGDREELLLGSSLSMQLDDLALHLQPQSFFQTNTTVARALYAQVSEWVDGVNPDSLWDLYCGVGGFALHCASTAGDTQREVLGVELSEAAVRSARRSANEAGIEARFETADATKFALGAKEDAIPNLVIVNPPRRGIGADLADWLENSAGIANVVYSSCNPESLARDLAAMPSFEVCEARVFDMFPHTTHLEVAVLLRRVDSR
ncbi:methyltransferase domain-containing protein [Leucobacter coleopterorum]|uniref:Methyltransferase domain-containing protein n=1 Tax=Leucobacter coleopterorum TaxID=2714933 RepID=A0ABX6JWP6_9MICO|nr:methyltransferase domain-containing protein [Leucobacter coleopterorum]QIM18730.1 methyltransferase domain-containing protein [Leucobacter coleopterorum]